LQNSFSNFHDLARLSNLEFSDQPFAKRQNIHEPICFGTQDKNGNSDFSRILLGLEIAIHGDESFKFCFGRA